MVVVWIDKKPIKKHLQYILFLRKNLLNKTKTTTTQEKNNVKEMSLLYGK